MLNVALLSVIMQSVVVPSMTGAGSFGRNTFDRQTPVRCTINKHIMFIMAIVKVMPQFRASLESHQLRSRRHHLLSFMLLIVQASIMMVI
jgi:hypothetical protein